MASTFRIQNGKQKPSCSSCADAHQRRFLAVNGVSLVLALAANVALLLNMARRLSFSIAQPITIAGFYIASILLIALVAAAAYDPILRLSPSADRALSQGFYYGIMAAGIYFVIATLMVITVWGAMRQEYHTRFELTTSQRTLMLQTISFMIYLLGGAAVYARIEAWTFLDAVYWADITLLTVGIGDYVPMTHLGRGLLFPYAIGGIVILGLVIGSIRSLVLERGKAKIGARMIEKKREQVLKRMAKKGDKDKLTPLSKGTTEDFDSERERREAEFNLMREIQDKAMRNRKWTSLAISSTAWFFLWFMGAMVFYKSERNQTWTYFESLYFAYTSLLTIGYGDFYPMSNSGKPFFVFWSLLAIPTLTILISNMGDTVVKLIQDLTLYAGEFTVLPHEDKSARDRIKRVGSRVTKGKLFSVGLPGVPTEADGEEREDPEKGTSGGGASNPTDRAASQFQKDELHEADAARDRGDKLGEDVHHYHYLLVREIRNVMNHLNQNPSRKYTFEEWAWFLKLIGEDEDSAEAHCEAPVKIDKKEGLNDELKEKGSDDKEDKMKQWSWLGNRSPLMGDKQEAQWVLEKLSLTLETKLKQQREEQDRKEGERGKDSKERGEDSKERGEDSKERGEDSKGRRRSDQQQLSRGSSNGLDEGQVDDALDQAPKQEGK